MNESPAWLLGARAAPSAHNTQPWRFAPRADGRIVVHWAAERALPAADPTDRDLFLSLGAAIEGACLAAALGGAPLRFVADEPAEARTVGTLLPSPNPATPDELALARLLDRRHTARTPHERRPVPAAALVALHHEARRAGRGWFVAVDRQTIQRLAALARRATAVQFADPAVQGELWRWLRLDPADPAYRQDGLTAGCLNLRGTALAVARLSMPPARMRLLSRLRLHHLLALDTQLVVRRSAALCLLTTPSASRAELVATGRLLLRLWLLAAAHGLTTHPVSALLDCAATAGPTVALFGSRGQTPAALFRLGATPPVERSPRLPPEALLEQTVFQTAADAAGAGR